VELMTNDRLRALRLAHGLTQGALARLVCAEIEKATGHQAAVEAQTISRIERGVITWPNHETRRALRTVLQADSDEDLGLYAKRTYADAERVGATKGRDLVALAALSAMAPPTGRIGMSEVSAVRNRFARLRDLDNYLGGADTFRLYANELMHTEDLLVRCRYRETTGVALVDLVSEQAQQTGWAAFDAGDAATARRLFAFSYRLAIDTGNTDLAANALIHTAYADGTSEAITTAQAAGQLVTKSTPPQTLALIESRQAWFQAIAGNASGAEAALNRARQAFGGRRTEPGPHWSAWINDTELDIMAGRVWAVLREPSKAIPLLERALPHFPNQWARDKALYLLFLADALTEAGNADRAVTLVDKAVTLAAAVASPRPINHARRTARRLTELGVSGAQPLTDKLSAITPPARPAW
jgi:transcriptional regulator with XRE-family HTH domain